MVHLFRQTAEAKTISGCTVESIKIVAPGAVTFIKKKKRGGVRNWQRELWLELGGKEIKGSGAARLLDGPEKKVEDQNRDGEKQQQIATKESESKGEKERAVVGMKRAR